MKRYLIGRDPMQIGHFRHWAYEDMFLKRGSMDVYSAVSGLEIAMWDITGKALDQPVYNLLGGAVRPALRVYGGGAAGRYTGGVRKKRAEVGETGVRRPQVRPVPRAVAFVCGPRRPRTGGRQGRSGPGGGRTACRDPHRSSPASFTHRGDHGRPHDREVSGPTGSRSRVRRRTSGASPRSRTPSTFR